MSDIYDEILTKDPYWHHKEYPSIGIEDFKKGQRVGQSRKNELIEWAYFEFCRLNRLVGYWIDKEERLQAENARLREALERLASPEAFVASRVATGEEQARMHFAQKALDNG